MKGKHHAFRTLDVRLERRGPPAEGSMLGQLERYTETFRIDAEIDIDAILAELGTKAARNRSKRAVGLSGLIKVSARRVGK